MTSLVFRALDQHVVGGLADDPAIVDERGVMSFAQLLHESASIAGAIQNFGITSGTEVMVDLPAGRERIIAVLALARLGAVPSADVTAFRLLGEPPVLHTPDTEAAWDLLVRAGRNDPAAAPDRDPDGYEQRLLAAFPEVFEPLVQGRMV